MSEPADSHRRLLHPAALAKIRGLEFRARMVVEGIMSGMHRSPYRGFSVEFAEHRKYSQGDDLRHLDWRILGRTDKHYVKQYEQETNLQLMLAVDTSASMDYRYDASALTKREYASVLAAAMAYLALHQSDAVGVTCFGSQTGRTLRATTHPGQWKSLLHEIESASSSADTNIRRSLDEIAEKLHRRHVVIILSDLFDEPSEILAGLRHMRHRRHEPIVLHVMDPAEIDFPFTQPTRFEGLEEDGRLLTQPRIVRQRYLDEMRHYLETLRRDCHAQHIAYELFPTDAPFDKALSGFLAARAARMK